MQKLRKKDKKAVACEEEKKITTKHIVGSLIKYSIPFIIVSIAITLYNTIDILTIIKPLVKHGHIKVANAEMILSVITTWGAKLNVIVTSIAAGVVTAVLPSITSDYVKKDMSSVETKINKTLQMILYFAIPMVIGLSFLAPCVWNIFYGYNALKISVFRYSIFTAIFYSLFLNLHTILQSVNRQKTANLIIIVGLAIKLLLNVPMIILFSKIPFIPTYYASITVTILAYIIPIIIAIVDLRKNLKISFKNTFKSILYILISIFAMLIALFLLRLVLPTQGGKMYSIFVIAVYSIVGMLVYFILTSKFNVFKNIFNTDIKTFVKRKLKRK